MLWLRHALTAVATPRTGRIIPIRPVRQLPSAIDAWLACSGAAAGVLGGQLLPHREGEAYPHLYIL